MKGDKDLVFNSFEVKVQKTGTVQKGNQFPSIVTQLIQLFLRGQIVRRERPNDLFVLPPGPFSDVNDWR